jgi:signal peptidase II
LKKIFLTAFIVLLIDQVLKIWIKTNMSLGKEFQVFNQDWFIIHFIENNGMAFGMEFGGLIGKLLLTLFRIFVVAAGIYYIKSIVQTLSSGVLIVLGLIIGGAIGNIIDSTFYGLIFSESYYLGPPAQIFPEAGYAPLLHGKVVDMFSFPLFTVDLPNWLAISIPFSNKTILSVLEGSDGLFTFFSPIFNLADAGISVGIFMILLFFRKEFS